MQRIGASLIKNGHDRACDRANFVTSWNLPAQHSQDASSTEDHTTKKKKDRKPDPTEWPGLKTDQLATLGKKIKTHFNWEHEPRTFQLNAIKGQLQRQDVLIHAGTGSGKTVVAAGPHVYDETKGMVTFMVAPLIVLQDEHVSARILSGNYHLHTGVR